MNGAVVGFEGDMDPYTPPDPRIVPDLKGWRWAKFAVCDDPVAMATFYAVAGNAGRLWTPNPSDSKGERILPRLLLLAMEVADWCAAKERTAVELYTQATLTTTKRRAFLTEADM